MNVPCRRGQNDIVAVAAIAIVVAVVAANVESQQRPTVPYQEYGYSDATRQRQFRRRTDDGLTSLVIVAGLLLLVVLVYND